MPYVMNVMNVKNVINEVYSLTNGSTSDNAVANATNITSTFHTTCLVFLCIR